MAAAGGTIIAGKVPGERVATTIETADSSTFDTTETVIDSVTASVVVGRIYRVRWVARFVSTVSGDVVEPRLREDSLTGAFFQFGRVYIGSTTSSGFNVELEAEYTADATEDKTFVGTAVRNSGSGTINADGSANGARYLYVDYIRG